MKCLFGLHASLDTVRYVEYRDGGLVVVVVACCSRCGARISEEVRAVAELHQSDD